jgi:hypothetical protein
MHQNKTKAGWSAAWQVGTGVGTGVGSAPRMSDIISGLSMSRAQLATGPAQGTASKPLC